MPKDSDDLSFLGCEPATLFRTFAAECIELAQTDPSADKRALYLKLAEMCHQAAQRFQKKGQPSP